MNDYPAFIFNDGMTVADHSVEPLVIPKMNFGEEPEEQQRSNVRVHDTHSQRSSALTINDHVTPLLLPDWNW